LGTHRDSASKVARESVGSVRCPDILGGNLIDKRLDLLGVGDVCLNHGIVAKAGLEAVA